MYYQNKLKKSLLIFILILFVIFGLFTFLQFKYEDNTVISFLNNIIVCTLTGAIVSFVQAWVGYNGAKRECIMVFYKNSMIYGKKVSEFIKDADNLVISEKNYAEIREINAYFTDEMNFSFVSVDKTDENDKVLIAVRDTYQYYFSCHKRFLKLEKSMADALKSIERSNYGANYNYSEQANYINASHNELCSVYYDHARQEKMNNGIKNIKSYLFGSHS